MEKQKTKRMMLFIVYLNTLFCLQISVHLAWAQRQGQVVPRDRQSHRHADVRRGSHTLPIKYIPFLFFSGDANSTFPQTSLTFSLFKLNKHKPKAWHLVCFYH